MNSDELGIVAFLVMFAAFSVTLGLLYILIKYLFQAAVSTKRLLTGQKAPPEEIGLSPTKLYRYSGQIIESRQWHAAGGTFHAEFWVKGMDQKESLFKLSGFHPEVRRGHRVTLYTYDKNLVLIQNHSTSVDKWTPSSQLLETLFPNGNLKSFATWNIVCFIAATLIFGFINTLTHIHIGYIPFVIIFLARRHATSDKRHAVRKAQFIQFCQQEIAR